MKEFETELRDARFKGPRVSGLEVHTHARGWRPECHEFVHHLPSYPARATTFIVGRQTP